MDKKTWGDVFKDRPFVISQIVIWQFFIIIMVFSIWPSRMADQAKTVVLQTYVTTFVAVLAFWIGASTNDGKIVVGPVQPSTVVTQTTTEPPVVVEKVESQP